MSARFSSVVDFTWDMLVLYLPRITGTFSAGFRASFR